MGDKVNLERALAANGRFGGHIVSGHIDGVGTVESSSGIAVWVSIKAPTEILKLIVEKGVHNPDRSTLLLMWIMSVSKVSIIPHTGRRLHC